MRFINVQHPTSTVGVPSGKRPTFKRRKDKLLIGRCMLCRAPTLKLQRKCKACLW